MKKLQLLLAVIVILVLVVPAVVFDNPAFYAQFGVWGYALANFALGTYVVLPLFLETLSPLSLITIATVVTVLANYLGWFAGEQASSATTPPKWLLRFKPFLEKYGLIGLFLLSILPVPNAIFSLPAYTKIGKLNLKTFLILNTASKFLRNVLYWVLLVFVFS